LRLTDRTAVKPQPPAISVVEFLAPLKGSSLGDLLKATLYYAERLEGRRGLLVRDLRTLLGRARLPAAKSNLAHALARAGEHVASSGGRPSTWYLTESGRTYVESLLPQRINSNPTGESAMKLKAILDVVADPETSDYLREALTCLDAGALRAAVVFTWVGSVHLLEARMLDCGGEAVHRALRVHDQKVRAIRSDQDFAYVRESHVLLAAEEMKIIDKSERQMLEHALDLRNKCGHPGKYSPGRTRVEAMIEDVGRIVFSQT